jgi:hypothetical protein
LTTFITRAQQLAAVEALGFDPKHVTRVEISLEKVTVQQNAAVGGRIQAGDNGAALQTVTVHPVVGDTDDLPVDTSTSDAVHLMFGLLYSDYLVVERTLLQSMPATWQAKFVALMAEFDDAFAHVDRSESFVVTPAVESEYGDLTEERRTQLGITCSDDDEGDSAPGDVTLFYDRDGVEHKAHERVLVPRPGGDPVPGYDRGRTRIKPQGTAHMSSVGGMPASGRMSGLLAALQAAEPRVQVVFDSPNLPGADGGILRNSLSVAGDIRNSRIQQV